MNDEKKSSRQRLTEWSKTPEGRESYEKVASEMRKQISEDEELENEICKSIENLEGCSTKINGNPEYHIISDEGLREFARHFHELGCHRTAEKYDEIEYNRQRAEESEKPMQEGVEEAVVDYFEGYWPGMETAEQCNTDLHFTPPAIMRLARHFAKWGAVHAKDESEKSVPNDAKEAAKEYARYHYADTFSQELAENDFIAGSAWKEMLMLKEAVEGEVDFEYFGYKVIRPDLKQLDTLLESMNLGDKVRVIVLPKED